MENERYYKRKGKNAAGGPSKGPKRALAMIEEESSSGLS